MSDAVSFWLDNKMASARKIAAAGDQVLVDYRGKYYIIRNGTALMKGSKPLHYSRSSLPNIWKKAMRGEVNPESFAIQTEPELPLPKTTNTGRVRTTKSKGDHADMEKSSIVQNTPDAPARTIETKTVKSARKSEYRPAAQTTVTANCPYCSHKHEFPLEKGKNGKPFFASCVRCSTDFAVRFVQVTMFQAQVAGFR